VNVAQTAAAAGPEILMLVLVGAGVLIVLLGSGLWWLVRERIKLNQARLQAGTEKMATHDREIKELREATLRRDALFRSTSECEAKHAQHQEEHERIHGAISQVRDSQVRCEALMTTISLDFRRGMQALGRQLRPGVEVDDPAAPGETPP
jgi:Tfp pilus assembly protein PilN